MVVVEWLSVLALVVVVLVASGVYVAVVEVVWWVELDSQVVLVSLVVVAS